jgi:predicted nucleotidyltransferase component of viral defense system
MLHYSAVDSSTLEILKRLLQIPLFGDLRLVGGTSLALQLGHRKSVDIDLFGLLEADDLSVSDALKEFNSVTIIQKSENITIYVIEGIKVDIVNYKYPWLNPMMEEDGLRMAQIEDVAAMKLSAISGRGTKKDFIDIFFLLQQFKLGEMMEYYNKKYYDGSEFLVLKSLTYFEDADLDQSPVMLKSIDWDQVKVSIINQVENYS